MKKNTRASQKSMLLVVLVALALVFSTPAHARTKTRKIDEVVAQFHKLRHFNGSILVADRGKVIYKKGIGLANMEWNIPNTPATKFRLASISKQFTAALILELVEQGKIDLSKTISDYLPDYRRDTGSKVTIHHLLNHTSGIPSYTNPEFFQKFSRDHYDVADFVKQFASGNLEFAPGSAFSYNNSAYFILGAIVEKVTGKSYEQAMDALIFQPLGMKNSGYDHHQTILKNRASGYDLGPQGFANARYLDMSIPYAAGSLYSTVEDLYLWDQALYGTALLSEASKALMFKPNLDHYGYGFEVKTLELGPEGKKKVPLITHGGGIYGFATQIFRLVEDRHLIVILDNTSQNHIEQLAVAIANILHDQPYEEPKLSIAEILHPEVATLGIDAAIQHYRQLKATKPVAYNFAEEELNGLGYQLMHEGNLRAAIAIFRLNLEIYPTGNSFDSLAEAYLQHGERDLAISHYKRALELDPQNKNAQQVLASLTQVPKPAAVKPVVTKPAATKPVGTKPASAPTSTPAAKQEPR